MKDEWIRWGITTFLIISMPLTGYLVNELRSNRLLLIKLTENLEEVKKGSEFRYSTIDKRLDRMENLYFKNILVNTNEENKVAFK